MKAPVGFIFFMLFLAGMAFVNLKGLKNRSETTISSAAELAGTSWRPTHIGEMRLRDDTLMHIQFDAGNGVTGHAGCNRFFGDYEVIEGSMEIGPLGTTRMACPEPANSFELSFLEALRSARNLTREQSRLAMRDDKGVIVARFVATDD